jgi:PAS domain S-box-containing protein
MNDERKTKSQLVRELTTLRAKLEKFQKSEEKRKRLVHELRESEQRCRSIIDNSNDAILLTAPDGDVLSANPAACRMFDRTEREICRLGRKGVVDTSDPRLQRGLRERALTGRFKGELTFLRKNGERFPAGVSCSVFLDRMHRERTSMIIHDLTERELAEEALRESEERFRRLTEAAYEGIVLHEGGVALSVNPQFCKMFGYEMDELLGEQIIPMTVAGEARESLARQIAADGVGPYECIGLRKDGTSFPMEIRARETEHEGHKIRVATVLNISERKSAGEALRESEELHRVTMEHISDPVFITDDNGAFTFVCSNVSDILGYTIEELKAMGNVSALLGDHLFDLNELRSLVEIENIERTIQHKCGRERDYLIKVRRVSIRGGTILYVCRDITERKRAEEALRKIASNLAASQRIGQLGSWDWDIADNSLSWSDETYRIWGVSKNFPLTYDTIAGMIHPDDRELNSKKVQELLGTGDETEYEFRIICPDGAEKCIHQSVEVTRAPSGQAVRMFGIMHDVTERKQAERLIEEERDLLRSIIDSIPDEIVVKDLERRFVLANEGCLRALGKQTLDQVVGLRDEDLIPERFVRDAREKENRVLESGETLFNDIPEPRRNADTGKLERVIMSTKTPLHDRSGRTVGLVAVNRNVTELEITLEALRQSESRFRTVWDNTLDGMRLTDAEGTIVMVNQSYCHLFKKESEELIGCPMANTYLPIQGETIVEHYRERFRSRAIAPFLEAEVALWNGEQLSMEISNAFLSVPGQTELLLSAFRDITDRKRAEEALRENLERFELANRATFNTIWDWNLQTDALWWNDNLQLMFGHKPEEIEPGIESWANRIHPEDLSRTKIRIHAAIDLGKQSWSDQYRFRRKDGSYATVADRGFISRDTSGKPMRMIGAMEDITERERAEEQLRAAKNQYQQLVENINEVIFSLDDGGTITYVSPAASVLGGYIPAELSGRPFSDIVLPEDLSIANNGFWRVLRGEMGPSEFRILTKSGDVRWVRSSSRPIVKQGTVEGISGVLTDITERKLAEEGLKISQEQLHQLAGHLQNVREEERKHLAQEFHDQLGQSLTAIKMDLSMLRRASADTSKELSRSVIAQSIESAQDMIDRAIAIIREILSELRPELLDQLGIVPTLEWEVERFQRHSGMSCTFNSEVGEIALGAKQSINLYRIFQEAITNVARHAKATSVKVALQKDRGTLVLIIEDNGIGISANAETKSQSFGLIGMRERAILLGGTLEIGGVGGEGTTILVRIPYEPTLPAGVLPYD